MERERLLLNGYMAGFTVTFLYLTFFDGYAYTGWNWLIAVPVNFLLSMMWPIYWLILRWVA